MVLIPDLLSSNQPQLVSTRFTFGGGGSPSPLINQPPGGTDTGSIIGIINDILQRIPLPPRTPPPRLPPGPGGGTGPSRFPLPIPLPIPLPGGLFDTGGGCAPNPCCRGQHLNKSMGCDGAPPGTKCVTNRRMNPLNPRALRRATRRLKGFERAVKSTRKQLRTLSRI